MSIHGVTIGGRDFEIEGDNDAQFKIDEYEKPVVCKLTVTVDCTADDLEFFRGLTDRKEVT